MDTLKVSITCPQCRNKITIPVKEMFPGNHKNCPYCTLKITFTGDDGRKAQEALDDFQQKIKRMFR